MTTNAGFDIATIKPQERIIEMVFPGTEVPVGIRVTLKSLDDEALKATKRAIRDRATYLEQRGKGFKAIDLEENANTLIFKAMSGWEWYAPEDGEQATFKGEIPDFNKRNVDAVLDEVSWFGAQLAKELDDTAAFFRRSKPI